jgi:hypothetical protein
MEFHLDEAAMNNIIGTKNVAELTGEMGGKGIVRKLQEIVPNYQPNRDMLK